MSLPTHCMRIAILINTSPESALAPYVQASWKRALKSVEPTARIDLFDPVIAEEYPDPLDYDLIILSGGSTDPRSSEPWVLKMVDFVRDVAASKSCKLLGICWGHQLIAQALGGKIETMETGPVVCVAPANAGSLLKADTRDKGDVSTIQLTPEGKAFLGFPSWKNSFQAPEFHVRWVAEPVDGFVPLAENHQAFLGYAGNIFTFQAHPEMDFSTVEAITQHTDIYTKGKSKEQVEDVVRRASNGHDGLFILSKIVQWVYDHNDFH